MGYKYDYDRLKPQNADWENDWHYKKKIEVRKNHNLIVDW